MVNNSANNSAWLKELRLRQLVNQKEYIIINYLLFLY